MTNMITPGGGRPPPVPATKGAPPPTGAAKGGDNALGFLALLAILGPSDNGAPSATAKTIAGDKEAADDPVASAARRTDKRDRRDTNPLDGSAGVVRAHPILPAPIILGTPTTASDGRDWRGGDALANTGAKGVRPILPDALHGEVGGDVARSSATFAPVAAMSGKAGDTTSLSAKDRRADAVTPDVMGDASRLPSLSAGASLPSGLSSQPAGVSPQPKGASPFSANAAAAGASPFTGTGTPPLTPSTQASVTAQGGAPVATATFTAPVAGTAPTKRRTDEGDAVTGSGGAFAMTDARLGAVTATGGTAAPATPHPAVVNASREIALQAQLVGRGQSAEMRLRLRPPDLGEVGVTVRRSATGGLTVHLAPASPEAAAVLRAHLPHLQTALEPHSQGQGAQVTLGQHDASGSSHRRADAPDAERPRCQIRRHRL